MVSLDKLFAFLVVALASFSAFCADKASGGNAKESPPDAKELLPKVWVTRPKVASDRSVDVEEWYDPIDHMNIEPWKKSVDGDCQIFKTAAAWKKTSGIYSYHRIFAFRFPVDDNKYLMEQDEFPEKVNKILKSDLKMFVNKNGRKPEFTLLEGVGETTTNSISLHIRIDDSEHIRGFGNATQLISKRYVIVDGRFFYLGAKCPAIMKQDKGAVDVEVRRHAMLNELFLAMWEQDIRRATLAHRLSEHGGDLKAAEKAIAEEIAAEKARLTKKNLETWDTLNAIARQNRFDAGSGRHKEKSESDNMGLLLLAFFVMLFLVWALGKHIENVYGGDITVFYEKVDRCLLTNHSLREMATQRIREEWALIIQFFDTGEEPRHLSVPAVLFLWERMFEPDMPHDDVVDLDKLARAASGLNEMFSEKKLKSIANDSPNAELELVDAIWSTLRDCAYSISTRIAGSALPEVPSGFGATVYKLLKTWNGRFDNISMLPISWKNFFKAHPEFAEWETLVRYGVLRKEELTAFSFLHEGGDGVSRGMMRKIQKKVELNAVGCNLYLPKGWDAEPESLGEGIVAMAGPRGREWLSVEYRNIPVDKERHLSMNQSLHPPRCKADGVASSVEVAFERLPWRNARFMRCHHADDMAIYDGAIEIEARTYRVFIVVLWRDADRWKFQYVFPASDGVTKEDLRFIHLDEILAAARIFAPIEITRSRCCSLCGKKMDDSAGAAGGECVHVWMKGSSMTGGQDLPEFAVELPWCATCRRNISDYGISKEVLEEIPDVAARIDEGASISEVKCGTAAVQLHSIENRLRQEKAKTHSGQGRDTDGKENNEQVAVKGDWKTLDMPEEHETFFISRAISPEQMEILRRGHVPVEMEDKWFWYMEGDTLFAHRSWSGYCIFRIDFSSAGDHRVTVNRDIRQYACTSIEEDRDTLNELLDWWTRSPYDYYGQWLSETVSAIESGKRRETMMADGQQGQTGVPR